MCFRGGRMLAGPRLLVDRSPIVGDVRDPRTLEPEAEEASLPPV